MDHYTDFKQMLEDSNVPYNKDDQPEERTITIGVDWASDWEPDAPALGAVDGYMGFYAEFSFRAGKLSKVTIAE
jgi:hypothetical protein